LPKESKSDPSRAISVVLPVKNAIKYINTLEKQLIQNISQHDEIIIVDDCSIDSTFSQFSFWARDKSQVQVVKNKNSGFVNALNLGVSIAQNDWIARWDQDDQYTPDRLKIQAKLLTINSVAVFSDFLLRTELGETLGSIQSPLFNSPTKISIVGARRTAHSSAIFSKSAFDEVGGYLNEDFLAEDISLWLRLSKLGNFSSAPFELLQYQITNTSLSGLNQITSRNKKNEIIGRYRLSQTDINNLSLNWEEYFKQYEEYNDAIRRKVFLFFDLISLYRCGYKISKNTLNRILMLLLKEKEFISCLNTVRLERLKRKKARVGNL
jgi:teichuronic acid biosynthesis glycosyltransferase TuaG